MKPFSDWTQEIAERNNMEPEPDPTDAAGDGMGYACEHYGYVTCPHCGYDVVALDYSQHLHEKHADVYGEPAGGDATVNSIIMKHNHILRDLKDD